MNGHGIHSYPPRDRSNRSAVQERPIGDFDLEHFARIVRLAESLDPTKREENQKKTGGEFFFLLWAKLRLANATSFPYPIQFG